MERGYGSGRRESTCKGGGQGWEEADRDGRRSTGMGEGHGGEEKEMEKREGMEGE